MKTRFGSWNRALEAAALSSAHRPNLSTEELFANVVDVWTALGRQPRKRDMSKPLSKFTPDPYVTRFGGWLPAMRAFADYASKETDFTSLAFPPRPALRGQEAPSRVLRFRVLLPTKFLGRHCVRFPA